MPRVKLAPLDPAEAVRFFRRKGFRVGFAWQDIWQDEHAKAFTVAKAMRLDILEDIRGAVDQAIAGGTAFSAFRKNLEPLLRAKGWWGRGPIFDPRTGKVVRAQLGSPRRLRTIFDVNLRTAYAAGAWERIERTKERRPFLKYSAILDGRTRPQHRAWHGTVLPIDANWWKTHYPPNGWNCRCIAVQLSQRDIDREGLKVSKPPPLKPRPFRNRRTGQIATVPDGIDPGWAYNVGQAHLRGVTPPPIGGAPRPLFQPFEGLPPLPPARSLRPSAILPDGRDDQFYLSSFMREFGGKPGKTVHFEDVVGERLPIGEDMFRDPDGSIKIKKRGRHTILRLLARTIKSPDEIWWVWEPARNKPGSFILRRRYIARWSIAGEREAGAVVFEWGRDGWREVTAFRQGGGGPAKLDRQLDRLREGVLAYRRKK